MAEDEGPNWAPPVVFFFEVAFQEDSGIPDIAFQEVSGLKMEMEVEALKEGGENQFIHQLPVGAKHGNVVLKRAVLPFDHALETWVVNTLEGGLRTLIKPYEIVISLIDADKWPVRAWGLTNAYPVKWEVSAFESKKNELVIETLELSFNEIVRIM